MIVIKGAKSTQSHARTTKTTFLALSPGPSYPQFPHLIVAADPLVVAVAAVDVLLGEFDWSSFPQDVQNFASSIILLPQCLQCIKIIIQSAGQLLCHNARKNYFEVEDFCHSQRKIFFSAPTMHALQYQWGSCRRLRLPSHCLRFSLKLHLRATPFFLGIGLR